MRDVAQHLSPSSGCRRRSVLAGCFPYLLFIFTGLTQAAELNVPGDFGSIQDAINAADVGDTIIVERGTYNEVLVLKSDLTLRGRETAQTFINPGSDNTAVTINALANVTFANFTIINAQTGVLISGISNNITIANNVFDVGQANRGFEVVDGSVVTVENNTFYRNDTAISRFQAIAVIRNNILFENTVAISTGVDFVGISFNCFFGNNDSNNVGNNATEGNPLFTNPGIRDFHLQTDSACIDVGTGVDAIDNTTADAGAYGGSLADKFPYPTPQPAASDASTPGGPYRINLSWTKNLAYLVAGYEANYGTAPGPPYNGMDPNAPASPIDVGDVATYTLGDLAPNPAMPGDPVLLNVAPSNRTLSLTWTAVPGATGYRVSYGINAVNENQVDVGNTTSYDLGGLENGVTYLVAVSAIAQQPYYLSIRVYDSTVQKNFSDYAEEQVIFIGPINESGLSNELTGLPEMVVVFPNLPNEGCFIATAAYGSELAPAVHVLRDFRDSVLLRNLAGRKLVAWYYTLSPPIADYIAERPRMKSLVRALLLPLVMISLFLMQAPAVIQFIELILLAMLMWRLSRRWRLFAARRNNKPVNG